MRKFSGKPFGRLGACIGAGLVFVLLFSGCGPARKGSEVNGKVAYKGQAVTGGTIKLFGNDQTPGAAGDNAFRIAIKPDGTFSASNLPTGPMRVAIETESVKGSGGPAVNPNTGMPPGAKLPANYDPSQLKPGPAADPGPQPKYVSIPLKYADPKTSGLTWDVKTGSEKKDFDLTD